MIKEIKKPDFKDFFYYKNHTEGYAVDMQGLDKWWDAEVEPINKMLREARVIYGHPGNCEWTEAEPVTRDKNRSFRAYLIGITEIRQDTAEDVLRDFIDKFDPDALKTDDDAFNLLRRAKAVLERGGE